MYEWQATFSVNHPLLDIQHRRLLALAARAEACLEDDGEQSIGDFHLILNDLMAYAHDHFRTEEQILRDYDYPGLNGQLAEHEAYVARLVDLTTAAMVGVIDRKALRNCLGEWWTHHILVSDMAFRSLFRQPPREIVAWSDS
jgi:hemerythrin